MKLENGFMWILYQKPLVILISVVYSSKQIYMFLNSNALWFTWHLTYILWTCHHSLFAFRLKCKNYGVLWSWHRKCSIVYIIVFFFPVPRRIIVKNYTNLDRVTPIRSACNNNRRLFRHCWKHGVQTTA